MNALFLGNPDDVPYVQHLKGMFNGLNTYVYTGKVEMLAQLQMYCKPRNVTKVVSTNTSVLAKLLEQSGNIKSNPSLSDYQGSLFSYGELEIVFISPLSQLFTVPYGKFLAKRFISKVVAPQSWKESTPFSWTLITPTNAEDVINELASAFAIAADIETTKVNLAIRCIGYTGIFISPSGVVSTNTYVLPIDSGYNLAVMRRINANSVQKIFQNGKYDNSYLLRYNAPITNWQWDTANAMHCWYSELPKDLAFLNAFFLRKVVYWKDLAETTDLFEYYKYNGLDTWATANVWIQWILTAPEWAKHNYALEFPLNFPCLLAEMTGLKRDVDRLNAMRTELDTKESALLARLQRSLGAANFNPGSPPQVKTLLKILGCADIESSNEKDLRKAMIRHPLNGHLIQQIIDIRELRKLVSTYLRTDADAKQSGIHAGEGGGKEYKGRILYALNPHATDTGRLASREHHFWIGLQIQNVPRGPEVKSTLCADDGFNLAECDLEQAESRDTAHIAGDVALIAAVSGTRDFHSVNASAFFGRSYESIYDDINAKTKDKPLRDLAKRVNHGANYNMGAGALVDTMGLDKIWEAARLLKLVMNEPKQIAEHLLNTFHSTYKAIRGKYYPHVIQEVVTTRMLVSRAFHHTEYNLKHYTPEQYIAKGDWTRYCFGNPDKNKSDLNAYVAHAPQSLNARTLNEAFMRIFYEVALPNPSTFRLHAQIHDSILFSYKQGFEFHAEQVRQCMEIPVSVRDVSGVVRTFTVPAALKNGKAGKPAKYWSETE